MMTKKSLKSLAHRIGIEYALTIPGRYVRWELSGFHQAKVISDLTHPARMYVRKNLVEIVDVEVTEADQLRIVSAFTTSAKRTLDARERLHSRDGVTIAAFTLPQYDDPRIR